MQIKNVITEPIHTTKKTILSILMIMCIATLTTSISYAQITSPDGNYYFGNNYQKIYAGGFNLEYHASIVGMVGHTLYDKNNVRYGSLFGNNGGTKFGLLDGDGDWSFLISKDSYTSFLIDGEEKARISPEGNFGVSCANPKAPIHVGEKLTMSSPTQTQTGWIGNNIYSENGDFKRVGYGGAAGISFDYGGSITFKTAMYGAGSSIIDDFKYNMKLLNTGGVSIDGGLNLTSTSNDKSIGGKSILRNQIHPDEADYEFFSIQVNSESARGFFVDESGRAIIGTIDPCQVIDINDTNTKLSVAGAAIKSDDAFWTIRIDDSLVTNVAPMKESLSEFMKISLYGYQHKKSGSFRYGVTAKEAQNALPNSVNKAKRRGKEYLTFNPNNLIFTGLKATQEIGKLVFEQQRQINTLEVVNKELTDELVKAERERNELKAEVDAIKEALAEYGLNLPQSTNAEASPESANSTIRIDAEHLPKLRQNTPNPFQQSTTITYYLPENTRSAALHIHDMAGKVIAKHILPAQKGEGKIDLQIENTEIKRGAFTYTLYINNTPTDSKKMILLSE